MTMQAFNFSSKHILITGASSGIGRQIAIDCLNLGAFVYGVGRKADELTKTASLSQQASNFHPFILDLTDESSIDQLTQNLPALDGMVANAGVASYLPTKFLNKEKLKTVFEPNFEANVLLFAKLSKYKKIKSQSSLVFISSISSFLGVPGTAAYAASKAALNAYSRVLASELAAQKIRVNTVMPGIVETALISEQSSLSEETKRKTALAYPLGLGLPSDVSGPVLFLLSDLSRWMTGQSLVIDGGNTLI